MYCTNCASLLRPTDSSCGQCATRVKSLGASSSDVQYTGGAAPSSAPSARVSASRISSTSSLTNKVRAPKAATTKQDRANSKDILPTSSFGTTAEVNTFLAQVRIPNFCIHPRLVEFNNAKDRQRKITLRRNKLIAEGLPENAAQTQSEELADADTISVGIQSLTQKGSVLMLAGLEKKDLQQKLSTSDATTHVMLVFLKERKVSNLFYLYNSKY